MADGIRYAGDVNIEAMLVYTNTGLLIDLKEFLVEFNLYEDIFKHFLYGEIVLSDSINILEEGPIVGEEGLFLSIRTPTFPNAIKKDFRIFKVSDRVLENQTTQSYILHFVSTEVFNDISIPVYKSFEGRQHQIAENIFFDYVAATRNYTTDQSFTKLFDTNITSNFNILNFTSNNVKYVSPGWTPFKNINWLASKSIPDDGIGKNYLFFESNKGFYFGSIEKLFKIGEQNEVNGNYVYGAVKNIRKRKFGIDVDREMFIAESARIVNNVDYIKLSTNGYLSNRLITLDVYNKEIKYVDYDYVNEYSKQFHSSGEGGTSVPVFSQDTKRTPTMHTSFYPVNPKLFNNFPGNVSEKMQDIFGNRRSSLIDLTNIKMNIDVPGRTDIEVGNMINFRMPKLGPVEKTNSEEQKDKLYSGKYLVTSIHHRITVNKHMMSMEIIKDSLK